MSSFITNEDLYVQARRLYQLVHSFTGYSEEYQAAYNRWVDFRAGHPQIADEVSMANGGNVRGLFTLDAPSDRPWDEADEYQKFVSKFYWDSFLMGCPVGLGFRAEINALISFLRGRSDRFLRYKSQYGELFLVEWAIHHMPPPISVFLDWSLGQEEHKDFWTINAFHQHLLAWASIFDGDCAKKYYNDNRDREDGRYETNSLSEPTEQELFPGQLRTGGGPIAHFLFSKPEHRRYAVQMFKIVWFNQFELLAIAGGGIGIVEDTRMIDL